MSSEAELEGLRALAEAALDPRPSSLIRYNHGGGRLFVEQGIDRDLIADFYDEAPREFYNAASPSTILSLLDSLQSTRAALERAEAVGRQKGLEEAVKMAEANAATLFISDTFHPTEAEKNMLNGVNIALWPVKRELERAASREDA